MEKMVEKFIDRFVKCKSNSGRKVISALFIFANVCGTFIQQTVIAGIVILVANALFDMTFSIKWAIAWGTAIGGIVLVLQAAAVTKLFHVMKEWDE